MQYFSAFQSSLEPRINSRSMGLKLIVISGLALFMTIPTFFVGGLIEDRTGRADEVVREISGHLGGHQTFLGPTLVVPYTIGAPPPGAMQCTGYIRYFRHKLPPL